MQKAFGYRPFTTAEYRKQHSALTELALHTNKGEVIAQQRIDTLRKKRIILPPIRVIDRLCAEVAALVTRSITRH